MNRQSRWVTAAVLLVAVLMVVVAVMLLIAVVRLGVPSEFFVELIEARAVDIGGLGRRPA